MMISPRKYWAPCVFGSDGFGGIAKMTLKGDISMESKMYGFPSETNRFPVSLGATDLADSQKWHLKLTSVWRANCIDFINKMMGCICLCGRRILRNRRNDT